MPKIFTKIMRNGVPLYTVVAASLGILIGALLNVILPLYIDGAKSIFVYVYSASILPRYDSLVYDFIQSLTF